MGDNTRIVLMVVATIAVVTAIAHLGNHYLKGNIPIILMVVAMVISMMALALAGVYVLNKAVKD